jgi:putative transposase
MLNCRARFRWRSWRFAHNGGYLGKVTRKSEFTIETERFKLRASSIERAQPLRPRSEVQEPTCNAPINPPALALCSRTLRLKVRREGHSWLNAAAIEVNQVWNWANEVSANAVRPFSGRPKWLRGFDLCNLSAGASEFMDHIGADTIQRICTEYATKRKAAKRLKLRWRVSRSAKRSLGWVPFKAANLKRKGNALRFCGKTFRVFDRQYLGDHAFRDGCFAQDAVGDWWLCVPVRIRVEPSVAPRESVGIDLGLKTIATTSEGEKLEAGRWTQRYADELAMAQRRGHRKQAKLIHRKAARCRADALHKFSRSIVDRYQTIVVGDVSTLKLAKTRIAKSVLDSGWGMLKTQLQYKGQQAGRSVYIVSESYSTRVCGNCGALTGPKGVGQLVVRQWVCSACGDTHDRDVNAARNILAGSRCGPPSAGTSLRPHPIVPGRPSRARKARTDRVRAAA